MHVVVSCHINILIFLNFCVFNFQTELINDKKGKGSKFTSNTLYTINMQITIYNQITFAAFPQGSVVDTSSPDLNL